MAKLTVEVVTPEKRILTAQADEAILPGANGLFGVRPGHTPLLSLMDAGPLTLKDGSTTTQAFFVAGGFVEVMDDRVMVLADQAEPVAGIDVEAAAGRLKAAQEKLKGLTTQDAAYETETTNVRRETARLSVAGRPPRA